MPDSAIIDHRCLERSETTWTSPSASALHPVAMIQLLLPVITITIALLTPGCQSVPIQQQYENVTIYATDPRLKYNLICEPETEPDCTGKWSKYYDPRFSNGVAMVAGNPSPNGVYPFFTLSFPGIYCARSHYESIMLTRCILGSAIYM